MLHSIYYTIEFNLLKNQIKINTYKFLNTKIKLLMLQKIKSFLLENKTDKQTIIKNTLWLMLAEGFSKWWMFLITILIARILWPEQFWVLSFVMSFVAMFIVITDFGLTTLMVREVSRDHSKIKDYLVNLSFLKVILWVITFILVWIVSHFIWKPDFYTTLILIYCWYAILNNFWEFIRAFFRPFEEMQYEALLKIINWILMLVIVLSILFLYWDLKSILWGYLIAGGLSLGISLMYVWKKFEIKKFKLNKNIIKNSLKSGVYLMWSLFAIWIFSNTDKIMLWFFWYNYDLWLYTAILRLINIWSLIISLFVLAAIPNLLKQYSTKKIYKILKTILFTSIITFIVWIILWKQIIYIVYWSQYASEYTHLLLIVFLIMFLFNSINTFFFHYLNNIWIEKWIFYFTLVNLLLNVIGNYFLIPIYKWLWAAMVTIIMEIIMTNLIFIFYRKKIFRKN